MVVVVMMMVTTSQCLVQESISPRLLNHIQPEVIPIWLWHIPCWGIVPFILRWPRLNWFYVRHLTAGKLMMPSHVRCTFFSSFSWPCHVTYPYALSRVPPLQLRWPHTVFPFTISLSHLAVIRLTISRALDRLEITVSNNKLKNIKPKQKNEQRYWLTSLSPEWILNWSTTIVV